MQVCDTKIIPNCDAHASPSLLTITSVVTGLTSLTGGIHSLITAYINHSNQLLSGQGAESESIDTAAINAFFSTGGIPALAGPSAVATAPIKKEKKKRVKKEKDPDAPKRPLTAFFLFSTNARELVKTENPESTPVEVNNEILRRWNGMGPGEKQVSYPFHPSNVSGIPWMHTGKHVRAIGVQLGLPNQPQRPFEKAQAIDGYTATTPCPEADYT